MAKYLCLIDKLINKKWYFLFQKEERAEKILVGFKI